MPKATTSYVYFQGGRHQRQPSRPASANFIELPQYPPVVNWPMAGFDPVTGLPITYEIGILPPQNLTVNGEPYTFAFVNIIGGTSGGGISFDYDTLPSAPVVGTAPIVALVVYVGLGGGPGSGATIDAFDESTNQLIGDTFVSVLPDNPPGNKTGSLTSSGNMWGWVDTSSSVETITALNPPLIYPSNAPDALVFDSWYNLPQAQQSGVAIAGTALTVSQGTSVTAFAFYKTPASTIGSGGGGGGGGPGGPYEASPYWSGGVVLLPFYAGVLMSQGMSLTQALTAILSGNPPVVITPRGPVPGPYLDATNMMLNGAQSIMRSLTVADTASSRQLADEGLKTMEQGLRKFNGLAAGPGKK